MKRPSISILGPGKVGVALAKLARSVGYEVAAVGARNLGEARAAAGQLGPETLALDMARAASTAELIFLTVSDSAIEGVAKELAAAAAIKDGSVLVHCSGALTSEILAPVRENNQVALASFHPLQTFPTVESAEANLPGSFCFLEGEDHALEMLEVFGAEIGAHCTRIETQAKPLYHAGAVIACNYLCTLMEAALSATEAAGIERTTAWPALQPLILSTLANIGHLGPAAALTGPIARGDDKTVALHLRALTSTPPELQSLYRSLGVATLDLATKENSDMKQAVEDLRRLLRARAS